MLEIMAVTVIFVHVMPKELHDRVLVGIQLCPRPFPA